ncbi:MAG: hypothetical protein QOI65_1028 [Thermoleophilaceae bacterium]|nr:hypothetical protein [Thermoleophilaceae bacterium]
MAGEALFIGWSQTVRGREEKALQVFNESVAYWNSLKEDGSIDSLDVVFLLPHGGDLGGFALLKGDAGKLDEVRRSDEFMRQVTRANLIVDGVGVVPALTGEALGAQVGLLQQQLGELT